MRSVCFSVIHLEMWLDSLKMKGKTASAVVAGKYIVMNVRQNGCLQGLQDAGMFI